MSVLVERFTVEGRKNTRNCVTYYGYSKRVINEVARMVYGVGDDTEAEKSLPVEQAKKQKQ